MEPTKHMSALRIGAALAIVAIALAAYSGVGTPENEVPAATTPGATAARQYRDPSLAGLSVAAEAQVGDVEIYY
jgi:hypothetical protein